MASGGRLHVVRGTIVALMDHACACGREVTRRCADKPDSVDHRVPEVSADEAVEPLEDVLSEGIVILEYIESRSIGRYR
jgi:hypothetical protein